MNEADLLKYAHEGARIERDRIFKRFPDLDPRNIKGAVFVVPTPSATKPPAHWTQRPENRAKVARHMRTLARKRRRQEEAKRGGR